MTILATQTLIMNRVEAGYGVAGRALCEWINWHNWSRWERMGGTIKERGRVRDVTVQARECIRCGYGEVKLLT